MVTIDDLIQRHGFKRMRKVLESVVREEAKEEIAKRRRLIRAIEASISSIEESAEDINIHFHDPTVVDANHVDVVLEKGTTRVSTHRICCIDQCNATGVGKTNFEFGAICTTHKQRLFGKGRHITNVRVATDTITIMNCKTGQRYAALKLVGRNVYFIRERDQDMRVVQEGFVEV